VRMQVATLERIVNLPQTAAAPPVSQLDPGQPTAAILVSGYNGLGIHTALTALTFFRGYFKNLIFISAGVIDTGAFKSESELEQVRERTEEDLKRYLSVAQALGAPATYRYAVGTDRVAELEKLCAQIAKQYPRVTFFAGKLVFQRDRWYHPILHNQTSQDLQKRLNWAGIPLLILPIRVK
ncbi:MAG TPA: hypothetical protein VG711_04585, partial [Phycisphaerales bacterium]|nr:hypothetical protein [Phycisphaerales bacterium]